jgi:hypothetical protein
MTDPVRRIDGARMPKINNIPETGIDYANLEAHPLANLLPMMEGQEKENVKADIARNGLKERIKLSGIRPDDTVGALRILDGRNRYSMLKEIGIPLTADMFEPIEFETYAKAEAYVLSTNFHRRQLNNAQKREVIAALIAKYPKETNRGLSRICGINHVTISSVRKALANPQDKKEYEACKESFQKLLAMDDKWLAEFAEEFAVELRELQELSKSEAA